MQSEQPDVPPPVQPSAVPVFILCGGLGTRLRKVESRPKATVPVAGLPFLTYPLRLLRTQGFRTFHLLVGVQAERVEKAFAGPGISFSRETSPLGTAGALALARERAGPMNLILNGDSYAEALYPGLIAAHAAPERAATRGLTLLALYSDESADYGGLEIDARGRVAAFREKGVAGPGWINAGVYAAGAAFFQALPDGPASLEREILPGLVRDGLVWAVTGRFFFRDIGTPERLGRAQEEFRPIRRRWESKPAA